MNPQPTYVITEGVSGMYHYHVSEHQHSGRSLCGAATMNTGMRLQDWGVPFGDHFPKRPTWCAICAQLAVPSLPEPRVESPKPMTPNQNRQMAFYASHALPNLTPWFDGDVKPARVGVYERRYPNPNPNRYSYWNGLWWMFSGATIEGAASVERTVSTCQDAAWRGLAEDPTATASPESESWTPEEWERIVALAQEAKTGRTGLVAIDRLRSYAHMAASPHAWTRPLTPAAAASRQS
jgi:hypothetical protein